MRKLNFRFAAGLFFVLTLTGVGAFLLHRVQYERISKDLLWQVESARDGGQTDDAIRHAYRYLEFRPDDVDVLVQLAGWLEAKAVGRRQFAGAVGVLERALRVQPDRNDLRRRVVALDLRLGQFGESLDHLDRLLQEFPNDAELLASLGEARQWTGKHADAAEAYAKSLKADPARVATYLDYSYLLNRHLRRPEEARKLLREAVKLNPQNAEAHAALAKFLRSSAKNSEAEVEALEAVRLGPNNVAVILSAGEVFQGTGKYRRAREFYQRACELAPQNGRVVCSLAWLMLHEGKSDEAATRLRDVLRENPGDVDALTLLGDILAMSGKIAALEQVVADLDKARAASPQRGWNVDYMHARLLMRRGEWAKARESLDKLRLASSKTPALAKQASYLLAECFANLHDRGGELDAYRRVVEADPNAGYFRLEFARALARAGQFDDAVSQFRAAANRADVPTRALLEVVGDVFERCRTADHKASLAELDRSFATIRGDDPNTGSVLAKVELLRLRGREAEALPLAEAYLKKHPGHATMHTVYVRILEGVFGLERAAAALSRAEQSLGDLADFRVARLRLMAPRCELAQAQRLFGFAEKLDDFTPDDRMRILTELISALGTVGDVERSTRAMEMLRAIRADYVGVREVLLTRALSKNDQSAMTDLVQEIAGIEGPDGWTVRRFEAERMVNAGDPAARERLESLNKIRPGEPRVTFLLGRIDEIEGRSTALEHYRTAFSNGLLDLPTEELFTSLANVDAASRKVRVLIEESPLADRLRLESDRAVIRSILPLAPASARSAIAERILRANAIAAPPQLAWLGKLFGTLGLSRHAEAAFAQASVRAPNSVDVPTAQLAYYNTRGDTAKAAEVQQHLRRISPRDQTAGRDRRQVALGHIQSGRLLEARRELQAIIDTPSAPADATAWARRTLATQLAVAPSLESFRTAMNLLDANSAGQTEGVDDRRVRALVLAAQRSRPMAAGRTARQDAIVILEGLEKQSPKDDDLILLARLYRAEGQSAEYGRVCSRIASQFASNFTAQTFLAQEALRFRSPDAAERHIAAMERIDSQHFDALAVRFTQRMIAGDKSALAKLDAYIAAAPEGPARFAHMVRGGHLIADFLQNYPLAEQSDLATHLRESAIRYYRSALGHDPQALMRLVTLYSRNNQTAEALDLLQTPTVRKQFSEEAQAAAAVSAIRAGGATPQQVSAVEKAVAELVRQKPDSTSLLLSQADLADHLRQQVRAEALYRRVLDREPSNLFALNNLAWIMSYDPAKIAESLRLIQEAIDHNGPLDDLLDTRSRILFSANEREAGLRDLAEAIQESPTAARYFSLAVMQRQAGRPDLAAVAMKRAKQYGLSPADVHPLDTGAYHELAKN